MAHPRSLTQALPVALALISALAGLPAPAQAGTLTGHYRENTTKGALTTPFQEFYEWNVFLCPMGQRGNYVCRTGACGGAPTHDGRYVYEFAAEGPATLFADQPNFFAAPKVKAVNVGANTVEHMAPNTDYHMAFGQKMDVWGGNPWDWHTGTWYQTFVATGTGINRVSFKLASPAQTVRIAIHESNGGAVNTWPEVGPSRSVDAGCSGCDVWAAWRHGEIRTVPGRTYAVSFQNTGGSMGFFIHRDSHGPGYNEGTAYKDAQPQSFDLYAIVFSDNDGTLLTYQMENSDIGMATEWAGAWAQSFTAKGTSLAAVGLFAQNPNDPQWPADVLIFDGISGGQQGAQVGPRKQIRDAGWYGPGTGYGGMSYNRGEVPLTPGRKYLIVFSPYDFNGGGFNPLRRPGGNVLPDGEAYIGAGGTWVMKNYDLSMTILEYAADQTPTPTPTLGPTATPTAPPSSPTPTPPPGPAGLNVY